VKVLVFQVWKSCFQHAANGYLVMHSLWGIFDVTIAFLDPENVDFDVLYAILLTSWITSLCVIVLMSAILENGALCESHTFDNVITQFRDPHSLMIDFRHVDKCWYSAATYSKTRAFFGLCCSTNMNFYTNDKKITNQVVYARLTFLFECL